MLQRIPRLAAVVALACLALAVTPADAKYRYGRYSGGQDGGFFVHVEGGVANPRNTDAVLATFESVEDFGGGVNMLVPIVPTWDDEFAGRLTLGYGWASGNKLSVALWSFSADQAAFGSGPASGFLHFAVGPPILSGGQYVGTGGSPGFFNLSTEIDATTADLAWSRSAELSESFTVEWSLGVRYANYEETTSGVYDEDGPSSGVTAYDAAKSNEGDMFGVRGGVRGSYRLGNRYSINAGLGFSFLDGELDASSTLTPTGTGNALTVPTGFAAVTDDGRSGTIRDLDLALTWHSNSDAFRVSVGWEQSFWDDITADLVRNFPGTSAPLGERDSVTFSGYKLGLYFRF